jgi:Sulfotransferase family
MKSTNVKVLYITGWGRSGTTILDRILGQIPGFNSVGEIRYIWDRNFIGNHLCGCGEHFRDCPEWQAIINDAFGDFDAVDPNRMIQMRDGLTRTRHLAGLAVPGATRRALWENAREYLTNLIALYKSIQRHYGCNVIVDSSKFPTYAFTLDILKEIDLYVVHLVRDPRAVSFSWLRRKLQPDTGTLQPMDEHGPLFSTLLWDSWNIATEMTWGKRPERYMFLRYEDFVRQPRKAVQRILQRFGEPVTELPFVDDHTVRLGIDHTCSGNPNRFQDGDVTLRMDDEWSRKMRPRDKYLVTSIALPFLHRYGYPIVV